MSDQRNVTFGIQFSIGDGLAELSRTSEMIQDIRAGFQTLEDRAAVFGTEIGKASVLAVDGLKTAREENGRVLDSLKGLSESGDEAGESIRNAGAGFSELADEARAGAEKARQGLKEAGAAAGDFGDAAARQFGRMEESARSASGSLAGIGAAGAEAARDTVGSLEAVGRAAESAGSRAARSVEAARESIEGIGGAVKDAGDQTVQSAAVAQRGIERIGNAAEECGSQAVQSAGVARENLEAIGKTAEETADQTVKSSGTAQRSIESIGKASREMGSQIAQGADLARESIEGIGKASEELGSQIAQGAGTACESIENVGKAAEEAGGEISRSVGSMRSDFKSAGSFAEEFGSQIAQSADMAQSSFKAAGNAAEEFGSRAARSADDMRSSFKNAGRDAEELGSQVTQSADAVKSSFHDAGRAVEAFGSQAAQSAGIAEEELSMFRRAVEAVKEKMEEAGQITKGVIEHTAAAVHKARDSLDEHTEAVRQIGRRYREAGVGAETFREAVVKTSASAIKETNSVISTIHAGFQGAYGYAGKELDKFQKKLKTGASTALKTVQHPIRTIRSYLSEALSEANRKLDETKKESEETEESLKDVGGAGETAGTKIRDSIGSAVKSFFAISAAIELVKAGISAVKSFASAIINAGLEAERTGAKFDAMFRTDSGVSEWAENFSSAIHRSNTEVQSFLVSNKKLYQELGITGNAADSLSKITTSLAYDLGAAFKMDDAEALSTIQDYIGGNTDALTEYGIRIDEAVLKQSALMMGLGNNLDTLNDATLAQVRMNALLENSTAIQQAAAKKQEGYTNGIKSLKGVWSDFLDSAGKRFSPVFTELTNTILTSWPQIETALSGMIDMLSGGLSAGIPVITELAVSALPGLIQTAGELFSAVAPLGGAFLDLAVTALPPLAQAASPLIETFGKLAGTVLPPLARVIGNLAGAVVPPLVSILKSLSENVITPLMPHIESIANAILPALSAGLELIPPILEIISPILSGIADILSRVVGFLSKIAEWAAGGLGSLLDKASNLLGAGGSAKSAGANIPHNADGDDDFRGGWTHINERGGELAFLPSGSAIIPADKSDQIIKNSRTQNVSVSVPFNPSIVINISGNVSPETAAVTRDEVKRALREAWQELKDEDALLKAIQWGNA